MKKQKKQTGFSLVELVVVMAVMAILVGIGVPSYGGYIKRSKDTAVLTELEVVSDAAKGAAAKAGVILASIHVDAGKNISTNPAPLASGNDFAAFYGEKTFQAELEGSSFAKGAQWDAANGWKPVN